MRCPVITLLMGFLCAKPLVQKSPCYESVAQAGASWTTRNIVQEADHHQCLCRCTGSALHIPIDRPRTRAVLQACNRLRGLWLRYRTATQLVQTSQSRPPSDPKSPTKRCVIVSQKHGTHLACNESIRNGLGSSSARRSRSCTRRSSCTSMLCACGASNQKLPLASVSCQATFGLRRKRALPMGHQGTLPRRERKLCVTCPSTRRETHWLAPQV